MTTEHTSLAQDANDSQTRTYHHGNLRQALVETYILLLEELPREKISMRKLASKVGVAPAAVYNHFSSKEDLEVAVKIKCLNHFGDYLHQADVHDTDPKLRIKNLGIAYFSYSKDHQRYFNLIMSNISEGYPLTDELQQASMRSEGALRNAITYLLESESIDCSQDLSALGAFACWSLAHGISSLCERKVNATACAAQLWPPSLMMQSEESIDACFDSMATILTNGIIELAKQNKL